MAIGTDTLNAMTPTAPATPATPAAPAAAPKPATPANAPDFHSGFNVDLNQLQEAWEKARTKGAPDNVSAPAPAAAPAATAPPDPAAPVRDEHGRFIKQTPTGTPEAAPLDAASVVPATEGATPDAPTETAEDATATGETAEEAAPEPIRIALPSTRDGEAEVMVELHPDETDAAERIRMLRNNGLRRKDFDKKMQAAEQMKQQAVEILTTAQQAPEQLIDRLSPEQQARVAQYYLAKHFDALRPTIAQWWEDPTAVRSAQLDFRESTGQAAQAIRARVEGEARAAQILRHVESLIPETASPEDAQDFLRDAEHDLAQHAVARNGQLMIEEVPTLLAKRIARYGWQAGGPASATTPAGRATPAVLAPVGQTATQVAEAAKRKQQTIQANQAQRAIAKNVAPPSQGAVAAQRPMPPASTGDTAKDWDNLTRFVKQHGTSYLPGA